jgi:hypothetical protein
MNRAIPKPPDGSCFVLDLDESGQPLLSWLPPNASPWFRWLPAAFICFWLCSWAAGEAFAVGALVGLIASGAFDGFGAFFLLAWLGGWTVGGVMAIIALVKLVRKPRPASLALGADLLRYDPGTAQLNWQHFSRNGTDAAASFWRTPKVREIPRSRIGKVLLDRVGERQRLTLTCGAERIEIGQSLREPEREWLAEVLQAWAGQNDSPLP